MQERAQRTRQAILEAAAEAFEVHGYGGTRLQDIVAGHDVSKGALYFHFPSKESLAITILQEHSQLWLGLIEELSAQYPRAIHLLLEFSWRVGSAFSEDSLTRAGMRLMLESTLFKESLSPPFIGWIKSIQELLALAREQGDLRESVDIAGVAKFMVATFTGLQQIVIASGGPTNPQECVSEMWRCLLPGLVPADCLAVMTMLLDRGPETRRQVTTVPYRRAQ
jgi:AcrR family transcriptional regulator